MTVEDRNKRTGVDKIPIVNKASNVMEHIPQDEQTAKRVDGVGAGEKGTSAEDKKVISREQEKVEGKAAAGKWGSGKGVDQPLSAPSIPGRIHKNNRNQSEGHSVSSVSGRKWAVTLTVSGRRLWESSPAMLSRYKRFRRGRQEAKIAKNQVQEARWRELSKWQTKRSSFASLSLAWEHRDTSRRVDCTLQLR